MRKKIFMNDLTADYFVYDDANHLLGSLEGMVSENLFEAMYDFLVGFEFDMQVELTDYMVDAVSFGVEHYTSIEHIDENLKSIYLRIDKELHRI